MIAAEHTTFANDAVTRNKIRHQGTFRMGLGEIRKRFGFPDHASYIRRVLQLRPRRKDRAIVPGLTIQSQASHPERASLRPIGVSHVQSSKIAESASG